jgi:hypothetical protein
LETLDGLMYETLTSPTGPDLADAHVVLDGQEQAAFGWALAGASWRPPCRIQRRHSTVARAAPGKNR